MTRAFVTTIGCVLMATGCVLPDADIENRVAGVSTDRLMAHVHRLTDIGPRPHGNSAQTTKTLAYLREELTSYGLDVREEVFETEAYGQVVNLIATRGGTGKSIEVLEIGAHYDTVRRSPGADDNASGVAALLEIARVASRMRVKRSLRFCFFGAHEPGQVGSLLHLNEVIKDSEAEVSGTYILEMIGYTSQAPNSQHAPIQAPFADPLPDTGDFLAVIGNMFSKELGSDYEAAASLYVPELKHLDANSAGGFLADAIKSDHLPYWKRVRSAILLTDTASLRNPHHHKRTDLPATLDPTFLRSVTRAMAATALDWAQDD